jgi:Sec-independent protein translocase protein TatA
MMNDCLEFFGRKKVPDLIAWHSTFISGARNQMEEAARTESTACRYRWTSSIESVNRSDRDQLLPADR